MVKEIKSAPNIAERDLCIGCGSCFSICPNEALVMMIDEDRGIYIPHLNEENKCNYCGLCLKVCPGLSLNFPTSNQAQFSLKNDIKQLERGELDCYIGFSKDYEIRYNAASGGLITQLLIHALEQGKIDGAIVTKMDEENPLKPQPFIARTREEIIEASKSKYCPVPVNIIIKEIVKSHKEERLAFVGLPCHIEGLRRVASFNKKVESTIIYCFGLMCHHTPTFNATKFLLKKKLANIKDVKKINYRGLGWLGCMSILKKDGSIEYIPQNSLIYWGSVFNFYFINPRCLLCNDKLCRRADLSFGDALLPDIISKDKIGTSIVISRSRKGQDLLTNAEMNDIINLVTIEGSEVIQCQALQSFHRRYEASKVLFNILKRPLPADISKKIDKKNLFNNFFSLCKVTLLYTNSLISSRKFLWVLIDIGSLGLDFTSKLKNKLK